MVDERLRQSRALGGGTGENGQVLPLMILGAAVLLAIAGIVIDFGRIMVARAELQRSVDAAALAGTLDLPNLDAAEESVQAFMAENDPSATIEVADSPQERQIEVRARKSVDVWFIDVLNIVPGFDVLPDATVRGRAVAGFGLQPVDAYLAIDATGSMGASPCNNAQNNSGCPIKEAKDAAQAFVDTLLDGSVGSSAVQVGVGPFRGCYKPPATSPYCVPKGSMIADLSQNTGLLHGKIQSIQAQGGTGTNICGGLTMAEDNLFGPNGQEGSGVLKVLVILSDGDDTYNTESYSSKKGSPVAECTPWIKPNRSDKYLGSNCHSVNGSYSSKSGQGRERQLDVLTYDESQDLKSQGVEIYVVGLGVCGNTNSNMCDTNMIGSTVHDDTADRNLNKCIASSTEGTNDHYFEVDDATDLPDVFQSIAQQIAFRIIE